jgi:hypothetical protein
MQQVAPTATATSPSTNFVQIDFKCLTNYFDKFSIFKAPSQLCGRSEPIKYQRRACAGSWRF